MYRIILIVAIIIVKYLLYQNFKKRGLKIADILNFMSTGFNSSLSIIKGKGDNKSVVISVKNLFLNLTWGLTTLMVLSAMVPVIFVGSPLEGALLMVHITIAPFFLISLMITVLLLIEKQTFTLEDWVYIKNFFSGDKKKKTEGLKTWKKLLIWLFVASSVPAAASILLSMYPIFGTEGQEMLLIIHQYSVLILLLSGMVLFYFYFLESMIKPAKTKAKAKAKAKAKV